jgi:hypothetical protein
MAVAMVDIPLSVTITITQVLEVVAEALVAEEEVLQITHRLLEVAQPV